MPLPPERARRSPPAHHTVAAPVSALLFPVARPLTQDPHAVTHVSPWESTSNLGRRSSPPADLYKAPIARLARPTTSKLEPKTAPERCEPSIDPGDRSPRPRRLSLLAEPSLDRTTPAGHHRKPLLHPRHGRHDGCRTASTGTAAGLHAVGEAQVREAGVPLPHHARRLPGRAPAPRPRRGAPLHLHHPRPGHPLAPPPAAQPRLRPRLHGAPRRLLHRLPPHPPAPRLPRRLRLLQARRRAPLQPRPLHGLHGAGRVLHARQRRLPAPDRGAVGARRGHVPPRGRAQPPAQPLHGQRARRGRDRHVRRARPALRQDRRQPQGHRRPRRQLQPLQPDAVPLRHGRQPLQAPRQHRQLQPRRHGLQRRAHRRRPRQGPPPGAPQHLRRRHQHGEHHPQLVLRERPLHAGVQLPLPHGRRRHPALQPPRGARQVQVPARAHGAHAQGRRRQGLRMRLPAAGQRRQDGRLPLQGPHGHRRRRAQDQHHHPGAARAALQRAAAILRHARRKEAVQRQGQAVHPGLQARLRALLHPRRRARRARRAGEQPAAVGVAHGALQDDAAPLRQHLQQLALVRARIRRGQGPDQEGRQDVADRLRLRVQVQLRRLEGAPVGEPGQGEGHGWEPMGRRDPQVPRARAQGLPHCG